MQNDSPRLRIVPVATKAQVISEYADDIGRLADSTTDPPQQMTYTEWMASTTAWLEAWPQATEWKQGSDFGVLVWLYVNDGEVTEIFRPVLAG